MQKKLLLIFIYLLGFAKVFSQKTFPILLDELDNVITKEDIYTQRKKDVIHSLELKVKKPMSLEKKYELYKELYKNYEVFIADSAVVYTNKSLEIANKLGNQNYIAESKIQLARINAKSGLFPLSLEILKTVNKKILTKGQLTDYYKAYLEVYIYWMEYQDGHNIDEILPKKIAVQDSLISILDKNSYEYVINYGTKSIEDGKYDAAEKVLLQGYKYVKPDTREFSILNSIIAWLYEKKKDTDKEKQYLAISALSDIHAAIKENVSLRTLAILLFDDGEVNRANLYIKRSLEDANFYNARLRNIQVARVLPIIDKAYQLDREAQQKKLRLLLTGTALLAVVLMIAIYFIIQQMKKVSKTRQKLSETNESLNIVNENLKQASIKQIVTNNSLAEANHLKEQYIKNFFEICTEYIDRLENFKGIVNRKIKTGQTAEILKMTSATEQSARELKQLYKTFDKAFLNIYPEFVEEVNKMLRPEEQYEIVGEKSLNQELRVFALIRLGVTNNNQIASFLHYTLRTIYNYRSKVKSKAIIQDDNFESRVQKIGNITSGEQI